MTLSPCGAGVYGQFATFFKGYRTMRDILQEIYFDICDLLDSGQIDDIQITEPEEFSTLRELLEEQKAKLEQIEESLGDGV